MKYARMKYMWSWLADAKFVWLALVVNIIALFIALRPSTAEPVIRITGLVLQLFGIATVAWGISATRSLFGHRSLVQKVKEWVASCPLRHRDVVKAVSGISLSASHGSARIYGTHTSEANASIELRLDALEKNVTSIHERISLAQKEHDDAIQKSRVALKCEETARREEDSAIRRKLEATGTGGVHISAIGASWLFIGVILSTASVELAALVK